MKNIDHYFWSPKQPCPCPEFKCVIMNRSSKGLYSWEPAKCSEKHRYLCVVGGNEYLNKAPPWARH